MSGEEASTSHSHGSGTASYEDKQQAPGDSILGRKLKKILESDLETDSETAQALDELSTFFTDNSLHTRRFLRGEIERRSLQGWRIIMFLLISLGLFILTKTPLSPLLMKTVKHASVLVTVFGSVIRINIVLTTISERDLNENKELFVTDQQEFPL